MENIEAAKSALRREILAARRLLTPATLAERAERTCQALLALPQIHKASTVAAYVSVGTEPGTGPLLEALRAAGKQVLLPVLLPDGDLDWAPYDGTLAPASRGLLEPITEPLGPSSIASVEVVVVPAVAVGRDGIRLGRGGGSYDRALLRATGWVLALTNSEEVLDEVPHAPHDQRVHSMATPDGIVSAQA